MDWARRTEDEPRNTPEPNLHKHKMLDVVDFITERGGNPELIRESQRRRFESVEVVDEVIALWEDHRKVGHGSPGYFGIWGRC